jgi:hypothetical protein
MSGRAAESGVLSIQTKRKIIIDGSENPNQEIF